MANQAQNTHVPTAAALDGYTVYASALGCPGDTSLTAGGGTDVTARLQAALDAAPVMGRRRLVVDVPCLVSGLDLWAGTEIDVLPGCGFYLTAGANRPILRNKHPTRGVVVSSITRSGSTAAATTATAHGFVTGNLVTVYNAFQGAYNGTFSVTVTGTTTFTYAIDGTPSTPAAGVITAAYVRDVDLVVRGGTFNGNSAGQNGGGLYGAAQAADNTWICVMGFYGVRGLVVDDAEITNSIAFGMHLVGVQDFAVDVTIRCRPGHVVFCSGVNTSGPMLSGHIAADVYGAGDDSIALSADDDSGDPRTTGRMGPYVGSGPIRNVTFDLTLHDCYCGIRVMTRDDHEIDGVSGAIRGDCLCYPVLIDDFQLVGASGANTGNYRSLAFDIDVRVHDAPVGWTRYGGVCVTNNVKRLNVRMTRHEWDNAYPCVQVESLATVDLLTAEIDVQDVAGINPPALAQVDGRVRQLVGRANWYAPGTVTGGFLYSPGTVDHFNADGIKPASGWWADPGSNTLAVSGGGFARTLHRSTFSGSPGVALAAYTPEIGTKFRQESGTITLTGTAAAETAAGYATTDPGVPDGRLVVQVTLSAGSTTQIFLRHATADTDLYCLFVSVNGLQWVKVAGGVATLDPVSGGAISLVGAHVVVIRYEGASFSASVDGRSPVVPVFTVADLASTRVGFGGFGATNTFGEFSMEPL